MDNLHSIFINEARELLVSLEKAVLDFEKDFNNKNSIQELFRAMHTFKGSSGMFGFDGISTFTHDLENIYDGIREGRFKPSQEILEITLESIDHLHVLVEDPELKKKDTRTRHDFLYQRVHALNSRLSSGVSEEPGPSVPASIPDSDKKTKTFYVWFKLEETVLANGTNPIYLADDLLQLGKGVIIPRMGFLPSFSEMNPEMLYTGFEAVLVTEKGESDIKDVFIFVEGSGEITVNIISEEDILIPDNIKALSSLPIMGLPVGLDGIKELLVKGTKKQEVKEKFSAATKSRGKDERTSALTSIRVASDKLDDMLNLVSELVTVQARLSTYSLMREDPEMIVIAENMEKITRRLRDNAFEISLIPIDTLITRFQRLVRDLSKDIGKDIIFDVEGADTELDKAVIEKLADPILHILRNCIDHGIEIPNERVKKGKPQQGRILFKAYYSGTNVMIEISDDGSGIDRNKVREKALSKGLISAETQLSEQEVHSLLFMPGFSTAAKVTDVSGRGVGMDVVRRNIEDLRGDVKLSSKMGEGTLFSIRLPLTLSIIDGLLVRIADEEYILPLNSVQKCYEASLDKLTKTTSQWLDLDGKRTPVFYLREYFNETANAPDTIQVIKIPYEGHEVGLTVDYVIGQYQAVLKPLGHLYKNSDEFSGATILGDGNVALVFDATRLVKKLIETTHIELD